MWLFLQKIPGFPLFFPFVKILVKRGTEIGRVIAGKLLYRAHSTMSSFSPKTFLVSKNQLSANDKHSSEEKDWK